MISLLLSNVKARNSKGTVHGAIVALISKGAFSGLSFGISAFVAMSLGAAGVGIYHLTITVITTLATVCQLGLLPYATKQVSIYKKRNEPQETHSFVKGLTSLVLFVSVVVTAVIYMFSAQFAGLIYADSSQNKFLEVAVLGLPFLVLGNIYSGFFQGDGKIFPMALSEGLGRCLITVALIFAFSLMGLVLGVVDYLLIFGASNFIVLCCAVIFWRKSNSRFSTGSASWGEISTHVPAFMGLSLVGVVSAASPILILGVLSSPAEVGVFSIALKIAILISMVLTAVNSVIFPKFAALYSEGDVDAVRRLAFSSVRYTSLICGIPLLLLFAFPGSILGLFGEEFKVGAETLAILALAQFINVVSGSVNGLLNMTGRQSATFKSSLISALLMVFLCLVLIPMCGIVGAALAQFISMLIQMAYSSLAVKRYLGFMPIEAVFRFRER